jgi:predicted enzyme related to lactoylglutathione lyase
MHRSRVCYFVIDVSDLDQGISFWTAALDGTEEETSETSRHIYRNIRLPDSEIRILLQKTDDRKTSKERMHIDLETDDVEAEVKRLEALGAVRYDHQQERGYDFWVLQDPWGNEFCVLPELFPELLARRHPWSATRPLWTDVPGQQHSVHPSQHATPTEPRVRCSPRRASQTTFRVLNSSDASPSFRSHTATQLGCIN